MTETEKQLNDNLQKCRCCFRMLIDEKKAVEITEEIRNQFCLLTSIELLSSDIFASRICQLCASDLQAFFNLRNDLITKQKALYELAGIDVLSSSQQNQSAIIQEETNDDYEMYDEFNDDFDNEIVLEEIEETDQDDFIYNSPSQHEYAKSETHEATDAILKIEKISDLKNDNSSFDNDDVIEYYEEQEEEDNSLVDYTRSSIFDKDDVQVECGVCEIEVLQVFMDQHIETMHVTEIQCEKCDKKFQSKIVLKKHFNEDHRNVSIKSSITGRGKKGKQKVNYCPLCSKEYDYKKHLEDHVRSFHKKERNTECNICQRRFYHRDLKKHIEHVHGDKTIACEMPSCKKMFSCLENLKLHMRYHEEPKFVCKYEKCGRKFHQKILWEHHTIKHSSEKPIECNECGNLFYTVRDLKRHFQRVHIKISRKCVSCEMTFRRKDKYREHIIKQHKELTNYERDAILDNIKSIKWHETDSQ